MKRFLLLLLVAAAAPVLAASIWKPVTFGKRVLGPVIQRGVVDAAGKPVLGPMDTAGNRDQLTEPIQTHKWAGDFRWMTFAVDSEGAFNVTGAVCPSLDAANPDSTGVESGKCRGGNVQALVLTAAQIKALEPFYCALAKQAKAATVGCP